MEQVYGSFIGLLVSKAKDIIGDGKLLSGGMKEYSSNSALETLQNSLEKRPFNTAESLVDAIIGKKNAEFEKLDSLLTKKKRGLRSDSAASC